MILAAKSLIMDRMRRIVSEPEFENANQQQHAPLFNVVLLDDDEYVGEMLATLFAYPETTAWNMATEVDTNGLSVIVTCEMEIAEFGRDHIHGDLQFEVYAHLEHRRPHPISWTLEDLEQPGDASVARGGSFPATEMHDYGLIMLRCSAREYKLTLSAEAGITERGEENWVADISP